MSRFFFPILCGCLFTSASCALPEAGVNLPCVSGQTTDRGFFEVSRLDLLFVIENTSEMAESQAALAEQVPRLLRVLFSGDIDGNGTPDFTPPDSISVAVVTTDMGVGLETSESCPNHSLRGDDGVLRRTNSEATAYFTFYRSDGQDLAAFGARVASAVQVGTDGCSFAQPLEAALKAVTPSNSSIRFAGDTLGHADGANAQFLRDSAPLAIIVLAAGEDCSASDPDLFNPESTRYDGELSERCARHPRALYDVSRYVQGLVEAKANPSLLLFSAITEPSQGPSSDNRITRAATALEEAGAATTRGSIRGSNLEEAFEELLQDIGDLVGLGGCFPRPFDTDAQGRVDCQLMELLPTGVTCHEVAGREFSQMQDGRELCEVDQRPLADGPGWFYDTVSPEVLRRCPDTPQRIGFVPGSQSQTGASFRFECRNPVDPSVCR